MFKRYSSVAQHRKENKLPVGKFLLAVANLWYQILSIFFVDNEYFEPSGPILFLM